MNSVFTAFRNLKSFVFGTNAVNADQPQQVSVPFTSTPSRKRVHISGDTEDNDDGILAASKRLRVDTAPDRAVVSRPSLSITGMPSWLKSKMSFIKRHDDDHRHPPTNTSSAPSTQRYSWEKINGRSYDIPGLINGNSIFVQNDTIPRNRSPLSRHPIHASSGDNPGCSTDHSDSLPYGRTALNALAQDTTLYKRIPPPTQQLNGPRGVQHRRLDVPFYTSDSSTHRLSAMSAPSTSSSSAVPANDTHTSSVQSTPMYSKLFGHQEPVGGAYSKINSSSTTGYNVSEKKRLEEKEAYRRLIMEFSSRRPRGNSQTPLTSGLGPAFVQPHRMTHREKPRVLDNTIILEDDTTQPVPDPLAVRLGEYSRTLPGRAYGSAQLRKKYSSGLPYDFIRVDDTSKDLQEGTSMCVPDHTLNRSSSVTVPDIKNSPLVTEEWLKSLTCKYQPAVRERGRQIAEERKKLKLYELKRLEKEKQNEEEISRRLKAAELEPAVIEEIFDTELEDEEFPVLTVQMERLVDKAFYSSPPSEVLVQGFKINVTRKDIHSLQGLNWLNDEVINFYMNMLMARGEQEGNAKVHAFNTFFYPKVLDSGFSGVARWTRRTDIFKADYIIVPVHLGMHWCLSVVDMKAKCVRYYDSMGGKNVQCLNLISKYLCDESLDKKKRQFDLSGWTTEIVKDIPEQLNGSDCGMFACKYAEYITRGAPISFTQSHMPYFRRRMVYEILTKKLL